LVPIPIAAVCALGSYSGGALPWLQERLSLGWFVVAALAVVGFVGAYAATEPPPPRPAAGASVLRRLGGARVGAVAALCFSVYLMSVLAWYIPDGRESRLVGELTWWGVPTAVCFWTLFATAIAAETESSGSGDPAAPSRRWGWLQALRVSVSARRLGYLVVFGGTVAFAVLGSIPGVVWYRPSHPQAWQGHGYATSNVYNGAFTLWAGALLIVSCLYLAQAFRARPAGLPSAVLRRAWYALWASAALVVLMAFFGLAAHGILAEPVIDLALALYSLFFVVMVVDASATTRHRRVKSSLGRRVLSAVGTVAFAFMLSVLMEPSLGLFRAGLLAVAVSAAIPLFPVVQRGLFGIERKAAGENGAAMSDATFQITPTPLDAHQRELLYDLLTTASQTQDG
jgi:hypothetical protein